MFCPGSAYPDGIAAPLVTVPCRGSSLFCHPPYDCREELGFSSQSPVEDHRCSAWPARSANRSSPTGHSPLSRIIVVLPNANISDLLLVPFVTVPCRGSSLFCQTIWVNGHNGPHGSQSPVEDHRCSAVVQWCADRRRRRVTVPCRGSSLFCPVAGKAQNNPYGKSQSPVEDHRCSADWRRGIHRARMEMSQSPVEDHRCSALQKGHLHVPSYFRHSPLSRIIVVLPSTWTACRYAALKVTVPCRGSSLFCLSADQKRDVANCSSQSPVEDHRCSAPLATSVAWAQSIVTVPCRGSSLFCQPTTSSGGPGSLSSQSPVEDHRCSAHAEG